MRGSAATAGSHIARYGGNTTCIEVEVADDLRVIIDCGTGLRRLQHHLGGPRPGGRTFEVFLTHYHWDHVQGLPFFRPVYDPANRFTFHAVEWEGRSVAELLEGSFHPPYFPVALSETESEKRFAVMRSDRPVDIGDLRVKALPLEHPQGVLAYRLEHGGRSVVVATDYEAGAMADHTPFVRFAARCDVLIHDAQYLTDEYQTRHIGWGHSTWEDATAAALEVGAGRLVLVSHDPDRSDPEIDTIRRNARSRFPRTDAAYEGMTITF